MRTLAILFTIVAVSSAATIMTMDDKELERAMMEHMLSQDSLNPMMDFGALMASQHHDPEPAEATADDAEGGERGAREAEEVVDDHNEDAAEEVPQQPYNMFANGMMAMVFPDMPVMGAIPYAANQPNRQPAGGNNQGSSNGKRGGGSAAAASATSFSKGSNSFSSSQAQAFSGGFGQGS